MNQVLAPLNELRIAVLATDGFEESELIVPVRALRECGARVDIVSLSKGEIRPKATQGSASRVRVDYVVGQITPNLFDALLLPGGKQNAGVLRDHQEALRFIADFDQSGKPIAAICHAAWELAAAGLVKGRRLTSYPGIKDNVRIAGGTWIDEPVVVDGNWVTSRVPSDIPAFIREFAKMLEQVPKTAAA